MIYICDLVMLFKQDTPEFESCQIWKWIQYNEYA